MNAATVLLEMTDEFIEGQQDIIDNLSSQLELRQLAVDIERARGNEYRDLATRLTKALDDETRHHGRDAMAEWSLKVLTEARAVLELKETGTPG